MKIVVQRVKSAQVAVDGEVVGQIEGGLVALLGIHSEDTIGDSDKIAWFVNKLVNLRIFEDDAGKMNRSVLDVGGKILVVSQFTLYGSCLAGRRPSFTEAATPKKAEPIYERFINELKVAIGGEGTVQTGVFGAHMEVSLVNDGPVTLIIEDKM